MSHRNEKKRSAKSNNHHKKNNNNNNNNEVIIKENSTSVAGTELPPIPFEYYKDPEKFGTILLFYQYKEPAWTEKEHKLVLKTVIGIGERYNITGRGRVAPEGLNCTLSASAENIRSFCNALREWDTVLFSKTDFKLTDGIPKEKLFKSLSIRKTKELVAYGLNGTAKAPSLDKFAGIHLDAPEYHKAMQDKDTVIIDVRNAYESAIGNFQPPPGGAELIDPQMRNSIEFPKWLADERTQQKLNGKKVLMYCTGGIRCERATALLNQMSAVNPNLRPQGVYELQGGIERYIKTFPQGGYWKGKNYLFDRRMEQIPADKPTTVIENEITSKCAVCEQKWTCYRGKFKCHNGLCGVPVIVCDNCSKEQATKHTLLSCDLCKVGYKAPQLIPDLVGLKRKAELSSSSSSLTNTPPVGNEIDDSKQSNNKETTTITAPLNKKHKTSSTSSSRTLCKDRLFVSRLPLTTTKTKLESLFGSIKCLEWITDSKTGAFYGSCRIQMTSPTEAAAAVDASPALKLDKKKIKISYCYINNDNDIWPPSGHIEREYPPIGR